MLFGYLEQIVGRRKARRFFALTLFGYFTLVITVSYLFTGSITETVRSVFSGIDQGENLSFSIMSSGILTSICAREAIRRSINEHKFSRLVLDIVIFSIITPVVGLILLIILGVGVMAVASPLFSQVTIEMIFNVVALVAFVLPVLLSTLITWNILPGKKADKMKQTHSELRNINKNLSAAKSDLNEGKYINSVQQVEFAKRDFEDIQDGKPQTEGISERIATTQSQIDKISKLAFEEVFSEIRERTLSGNYIEAHELLASVEQTDIRYDYFTETMDSLREDIDRNLSNIVSSEIDSMRESIDRAKQAKKNEDYVEARDQLNVSAHESAIAEIDSEYIPDEFYELANQQSCLRSDIIQAEKEAQIQNHREQISDLLGIKEPLIKLNTDDPKMYQVLEETLTELDQLKREHPSQSWDEIEDNIRRDILETKSCFADTVQTYTEIISDSVEILRYIETVGGSHPSIHPTEWRAAVDTALKQVCLDSLKPVVSEIEQLKKGLWQREHLYQMSWQEFEHLIGSLYESLGYTTEVTQGTSDMGVDVWAEGEGVRRAIQVKQFSRGNTVGREPLQKTVSTIAKGDADEAVVITSSRFTRTADEYAAEFGPELELISGEKLIEKLSLSDVPPPSSDDFETASVDTSTQKGVVDNFSSHIGTPLTDKNGDWSNKNKYAYERFNDATNDIKELKRNQEHDKAEELLLWCINFAESETKPGVRDHPRWYYRHLAIIYRKDNRYQDEVSILQRYVSFCNNMNIEPRDEITDRLNRAKQLTED